MKGVRCAHDQSERNDAGRCRACHRESERRRREGGHAPIVGSHARRSMIEQLRDMGLGEYDFRYDDGRQYTLTRGDVDELGSDILVVETYCPDGYLQGEPCTHGCWSDELEPVRPTRRPRAPKPVGPARYVVLPPTELHPNEARSRRALTYPGDTRGIPVRPPTRERTA